MFDISLLVWNEKVLLFPITFPVLSQVESYPHPRSLYLRFWTIILYELFVFRVNATYPAHEILLDEMSITVFGEEYKLRNSSPVRMLLFRCLPLGSK